MVSKILNEQIVIDLSETSKAAALIMASMTDIFTLIGSKGQLLPDSRNPVIHTLTPCVVQRHFEKPVLFALTRAHAQGRMQDFESPSHPLASL